MDPLNANVESISLKLSHLWAKSPRNDEREGYPLFQHTLDVVWQAAQFYYSRRPTWPLSDSASLPRIIAYSALLHDFGKAHRDFQSALRPPHPRFANRHEVLSLLFVGHLEVPDSERSWLTASIASHHKGLYELFEGGGPFYPAESLEPQYSRVYHLSQGIEPPDYAALLEVLNLADEVFHAAGWQNIDPYPTTRPLQLKPMQALLNEAAGIRHFLRRLSSPRPLRPGPKAVTDWPAVVAATHSRGILINADHLASHGRQPVINAITDIKAIEESLRGKNQFPNSFQQEAAECCGNALLIAPTGSGKTEAALFWAASQAQRRERRGRVFFMLPYQTSMNAMQERLILELFPDIARNRNEWNTKVALAHGRSARRIYEALLNEDYEPSAAARLAKVQDDLARLHASPVLVSSAYSLIRLLLASKGAEGLWEGFTESRIIIDEIHAYDPVVTSMILASIRFLSDHLKSVVLIMSATMPTHLREAIESTIPGIRSIPTGADVTAKPPRHALRLLDTHALSDDALNMIRNAAQYHRVLVVLNQVGRAIKLFESLRPGRSDVALLHSRFNYEDRSRKESQIRSSETRILVATQTVEVSLDISFDECFSELAPLESLQQRFGRCNRKGERRTPVTVNVFCQMPSSDSRPYNPEHLQNVRRVLNALSSGSGPVQLEEEKMKQLLDDTYPDSLKKSLATGLKSKFGELMTHFVNEFVPFGPKDLARSQQLEQQWQELFDGEEVLPEVSRSRIQPESNWLERARLMVPVPSRWIGIVNAHWDHELMCFVADADYDSETGLRPKG